VILYYFLDFKDLIASKLLDLLDADCHAILFQ